MINARLILCFSPANGFLPPQFLRSYNLFSRAASDPHHFPISTPQELSIDKLFSSGFTGVIADRAASG